MTEAVTNIAETHVPDDLYERTREQFSEAELVALNFAVIAINAWNRIAITLRARVGACTGPGRLERLRCCLRFQGSLIACNR